PVHLFRGPSPRPHAAPRHSRRGGRQPRGGDAGAALPGLPGREPRARHRDPVRMNALLESRGLRKVFAGGDGQPLEVLRGVDIEVRRGELIAIVGSSGAGKSTLLHLMGALDRPSSGDLWLEGSRYADLDPAALSELRNRRIGFVFQFHHLLREFSALENVMLPMLIAGASDRQARSRAEERLSA